MSNPKIKRKIMEFLEKNHPKDFSIQEVADATQFHRNTVSTYLKVLVAEKKIIISRTIKNVNLYSYVTEI